MLSTQDHGAVRELVMSSLASRLIGYKVSAYLHRGILIDSGFPGARAELSRWLAANRVEGAIITHWHEDHAGNVPLLVERAIPVTIAPATLARVRTPKPVPLYRRLVWGKPGPVQGEPIPAAHPFELIPTPGHTDDHVAVWDPEARIAFTGDLFLGVRAAVVHAPEDPAAIVTSLKQVLALEPALVFDAHRGPVRDPARAFGGKIAWLEQAIGSIRELAAQGEPEARIVRRVLGPEDRTARISGGEMSKLNFVRAVTRGPAP